MEESSLIRLHLRAPLFYEETPGADPFSLAVLPALEGGEELLFCFELEPGQAGRIEPEPGLFLGEAVFCGRGDSRGSFELPAGLYLFCQRREALDREACIRLAIEQQKDGLWERLKPGNRLYIRRLFEDGSQVTQILRELHL